MAFAGSLSTFAIIKQNQIHTIRLKGFTVQEQGQKDEFVFPRVPQVGRG